MNLEEKKEKVAHMQKYFVKSFWVSFIVLLFASFMCMIMHDTQMAFVNKYFPMSTENFNMVLLFVLGIWKVLVIQFTLIPAIVLTCIKNNCCCSESCKTD